MKTLLVRADANAEIGTGHVMRCMALAQAWQDAGGRATFISSADSTALDRRLRQENMGIVHHNSPVGSREDAQATLAVAGDLEAAWLIVDGYRFGAEYQQWIKDAGANLLCVDDYGHALRYYADVILNQNLSASENLYLQRESYTELLLGTRYSLLRREFLIARERPRKHPNFARKILVTLGGSDGDNVTLKIIQALQSIGDPRMEVRIVIGPANPNRYSLEEAIQDSVASMELLVAVENMAEPMAWADLAVTAGGSTCWELCCMKLPAVVVVISPDQEAIAEALGRQGCMHNLGWASRVSVEEIGQAVSDLMRDAECRSRLADNASLFVDGLGGKRVVERLMQLRKD